jgi:4'-phosphopantetheinyl transferase
VARADRFHRAADRDRFVTGRALARAVLGDVLGVAGRAVRLRVDGAGDAAPGRPRAPGGPSFSVSHAGAWVLVAVGVAGAGTGAGGDAEVGVDVEAVAAVGGLLDDLHDAVPAQERPPGGWDARSLTRSWVRREAVLKAVGTGLLAPRDDLVLARADAPAAVLRADGLLPAPDRLTVRDLELPGGADHLAAVALHGVGASLGTVTVAAGAGPLHRHGVRPGAR